MGEFRKFLEDDGRTTDHSLRNNELSGLVTVVDATANQIAVVLKRLDPHLSSRITQSIGGSMDYIAPEMISQQSQKNVDSSQINTPGFSDADPFMHLYYSLFKTRPDLVKPSKDLLSVSILFRNFEQFCLGFLRVADTGRYSENTELVARLDLKYITKIQYDVGCLSALIARFRGKERDFALLGYNYQLDKLIGSFDKFYGLFMKVIPPLASALQTQHSSVISQKWDKTPAAQGSSMGNPDDNVDYGNLPGYRTYDFDNQTWKTK